MMEDNERQSYNQEDQDDFGLPEVEYRPIERGDEEPAAFEQNDQYYQEEEDESSNKSGMIIFGIVGLLLVLGLLVYLFFFGGTEQIGSWFGEDPAPKTTYVEPEPEPVPEVVEEPQEVETPVSTTDPLAPYSEVTTISQPTGRSFIVIGSFVDGDLASDYADRMKNQGIFVKILSPTDRAPLMHRVVVADYPEFDDAMQQVSQFRDKYGDNTWVLKY